MSSHEEDSYDALPTSPKFSNSIEFGDDDLADYTALNTDPTKGINSTAENAEDDEDNSLPLSIYTILSQPFFGTAAQFVVNPVLFLYLESNSWTDPPKDITFYTTVFALGQVGPVFLFPFFGYLTSKFSFRFVICAVTFTSFIGVCGMIFAHDKYVFLPFFIMSLFQVGLRSVRLSYVNTVTSPKNRTKGIALQPLISAFGAVLGPACSWLCSNAYTIEFFNYITISANTLTFFWSASFLFLNCFMIFFLFEEAPAHKSVIEKTPEQIEAERKAKESMEVKTLFGSEQVWFWTAFLLFLNILFWSQLSAGVYQVAFQPILVTVFQADQSTLSAIVFVLAFIAVIPPLIVAMLSKKFSDRTFIIFGVGLQFVGMVIYSIPPMNYYQVLIGFAIVIKSSLFLLPCMMSLFSKVLGPRATGLQMGILTSSSYLGPCIGSFIGQKILLVYDDWKFILFSIPCFLSLIVMFIPFVYKMMEDPSLSKKAAEAETQPLTAEEAEEELFD